MLYIKPLFLIRILHQTTTLHNEYTWIGGCFLFVFYIKPQHFAYLGFHLRGCFLFVFYIKPQHKEDFLASIYSCFLFVFYIKPQPRQFIELNNSVLCPL